MKVFVLLISLVVSSIAYSQSVRGRVLDTNNTPVEFASVRLFTLPDSTVHTGAYSEGSGKFEMNVIPVGEYFVKITFLNHEPFVKLIAINADNVVNLGDVKLIWDKTIEIEEVTAVGSTDILKAGIDKKIYAVEDDISVKGGSVNDILNNIPSVDVDQDGGISLRGDGNVTILIDGRPSALVSGNGQSMLDALPANSVERIEIVTNPSAKYDPDGTSGIINIVLKKNKLIGFNGLVSLTGGTGNQYESNLALSYRGNHVNLFANYSLDYFEGYRNYTSDLEREVSADSTTLLSQKRDGTDLKSSNTLIVGSDFYINARNTIGLSATGSLGNRERNGDMTNRLFDSESVLIDRSDRNSFDPDVSHSFDVNLNYTNSFKESRGEWSINLNQSFGKNDIEGHYEQLYYDENEELTNQAILNQQLFNKSENKISVAQTDFSYVLKKIKARVEAGAKAIIGEDRIITYSETRDTISNNYIEDTLANFQYVYDEEIYSLYAIFGQELGKFKYQLGVRGEYAKQIPNLLTESAVYGNDYFNFFPSAHVKYSLGKLSELSLSYSRRINRASSNQLNPFTSYADPFNLHRGNPGLNPEYIDSYDLGYSLNGKKIIFSFSIFHKRTTDVINRVRLFYDNNTGVSTYGNIDKSASTGVESIIIYKPNSWMKNTLSLNGNYIDYTNSGDNAAWNNDGINWGLKYILALDFWKKSASLQVNAYFNAPRITPQGRVKERYGGDISIEKRLYKNRFIIGARLTDVFNTKVFNIELDQPGITQNIRYKHLTRRFLITLSYKIGNSDSKSKSQRSSGGGGDDF